MGKFEDDLTKGKKAEEYICKFLHKWFPRASVFYGKKKEYDIDIPEIIETMEVKYDRLSKKTGNVAIEFEFCGKPSGVNATTANKWCIVFGKEDGWFFCFVAVDKLKKLCENKRAVSGGDDYLAKMYLLPIAELLTLEGLKIHPVVF